MKIVELSIPYPPSVNRIYYNRAHPTNNAKGRGLTPEARNYKKTVAELIHYSFPSVKYGDQDVKISVITNPQNNRGDTHNGLKIVFDAIQLSGLIDNDKQIVALEMIPGELQKNPSWNIKIEPYTMAQKILDKIRFWNTERKID